MSKFESNLSEGSVFKKLMLFAIPFMISNIVQSLYNVINMLIVGNYCGPESMAGVNTAGQVTLILTNVVIGLCSGGTVLIAQYLGAGKRKSMERVTATLFTLLIITALILTVSMLLLKVPLLKLIRTPAEAFSESNDYLTVTLIGIIFIFGYNALSAVMRGMGDSKRPFYFVLIACVVNIILDFIFVGAFGMKSFGAALATVISQALSMLLCIIYMIKNKFHFDFKPSSFMIDKEQLKYIFRIGLPTSVQNAVVSISFLIITAIVNELGGVNASAAVGAVGRLNGFAIMPAIAMGAAISTMSAQNIGAGKWNRATKACQIGTLVAVSTSVFVFAIVQIFPRQIISMFGENTQMIDDGVEYLRTFSFDYLIVPFVFCINGLFIGAGHTFFSLITALVSSILLRVPISYLFGSTLDLGLTGIGIGAPAASAGSLLLVIIFLLSGRWRINTVTGQKA